MHPANAESNEAISDGCQELRDGEIRGLDEPSQCSFGDFFMVGNRQGRHVILPHHDDVASILPHNAPSQFFEDSDHISGIQHGERGHQATTSIWRVSIVSGMPRSARTSRHCLIASCTFISASSFVVPWLTQPGIAGHSTIQTPFSSRSIVTLKIIAMLTSGPWVSPQVVLFEWVEAFRAPNFARVVWWPSKTRPTLRDSRSTIRIDSFPLAARTARLNRRSPSRSHAPGGGDP